MMISINYTEVIAQARKNGETHVDFDKGDYNVKAISSGKDTVSLSDAALAKMNGEEIKDIPPTYIRPETAKSLLAKEEATNKAQAKVDNNANVKSDKDLRFDKVMQDILDKRLGVDRKKLEEIDAMMEEIAKNENLSPAQKQKAMEELEKMKEEVIEESMEIQKQAKRTFNQEEPS